MFELFSSEIDLLRKNFYLKIELPTMAFINKYKFSNIKNFRRVLLIRILFW